METVKFAIIGGGLMGKEAASAFGRWFVLKDIGVKAELIGVCDINPETLEWYRDIPTVKIFTGDYKELLASKEVDVVYVAVPHNLHEHIYTEVLESGKDLLAEKPFGIDVEAATRIRDCAEKNNRFVRCSSEMPFLPGPQRIIKEIKSGTLGNIMQIKAGLLHSSDMDPEKPGNWKRQNAYCGEIGVMGDLGMHVLHIPLRFGWKPVSLSAHLQKIYTERPDGKGSVVKCDTWNNATLFCSVEVSNEPVSMILEMKRLSPGDTNTWYIEIMGTEGGLKYSTKDFKTLWIFKREKEQKWQRIDLGLEVAFPVITGSIFEAGFADCFQQMLASFVAERAAKYGERFGCVTPAEAVDSHKIFAAALTAFKTNAVVPVRYD